TSTGFVSVAGPASAMSGRRKDDAPFITTRWAGRLGRSPWIGLRLMGGLLLLILFFLFFLLLFLLLFFTLETLNIVPRLFGEIGTGHQVGIDVVHRTEHVDPRLLGQEIVADLSGIVITDPGSERHLRRVS